MGGARGSKDFTKGIGGNTELAKRNKHHHHLDPGGYYAKEEQFRKMNEDATTSRNVDVKNLMVRSRN